jgi:hypothetical protein
MRDKDQIILENLYLKVIEETMGFFIDSDLIGNLGYGDYKDRYFDDVYDVSTKFEMIVWDIIKKRLDEKQINEILDGGNWYPITMQAHVDNEKEGILLFNVFLIPKDLIKTIVSAIKYYIEEEKNNIELVGEPFQGYSSYPANDETEAWLFPIKLTKPKDFGEKNPPNVNLTNDNMWIMLEVLDIGNEKKEELEIEHRVDLSVDDLAIKIDRIIDNEDYLSRFTRSENTTGVYHNLPFSLEDIKTYLRKLEKLVDWCIARDVRYISVGY